MGESTVFCHFQAREYAQILNPMDRFKTLQKALYGLPPEDETFDLHHFGRLWSGVLLILFLGAHTLLLAQQGNGSFTLEANTYSGRVINTNKEIELLPDYDLYGFSLDIGSKVGSSRAWHKALRNPIVGFTLHYNKYEARGLGSSFSLLYFVGNNISAKHRRIKLAYQLGFGLGYFKNVYHPLNNTDLKALSTNLNIAAELRMGLDFRIFRELDLSLSMGFMHYSNGATRLPNYGMNQVVGRLGLKYSFTGKTDLNLKKEAGRGYSQFRWMILLNAGYRQVLIGQPFENTLIHNVNFEYGRMIGSVSRLGLGISILYEGLDKEYNLWYSRCDKNQPINFKWHETLSSGMYLSYEFLFGSLSAFLQQGVYLTQPYRHFRSEASCRLEQYNSYVKRNSSRFFNRIGLRYRIMPRLALSVSLKTHMFHAQYMEFGLASYLGS